MEIICPSFSDEGTFTVRARGKPWKQLIDVYENAGWSREKKPLLEVTAVSIPANTDFFVIIYLQQGRTRRQLKWADVSRVPLCSPSDIAMCPPDQWQWEITLRDRNGIYKVTCTMDSNGATLSCPGLGHNSYYSVICYQHKCTPY